MSACSCGLGEAVRALSACRLGSVLLAMLALSLFVSPAQAAQSCERGYISEIVGSADAGGGTVSGAAIGYVPRSLFRTNGAGFDTASDAVPAAKLRLNGKYYSEIRSSDVIPADYRRRAAALRAAFLSKTPVRISYYGGIPCSGFSNSVQITLCSSEAACN